MVKFNKLTLKTKKTKLMILAASPSYDLEDIPVFINGDYIEKVKVFKYLGVYLDECPTFDKHSKYIYNRASSKLGVIRKIRDCLGQPTALRLYKGLVLPHFDFCDMVHASQDTLQKLQLYRTVRAESCSRPIMNITFMICTRN